MASTAAIRRGTIRARAVRLMRTDDGASHLPCSAFSDALRIVVRRGRIEECAQDLVRRTCGERSCAQGASDGKAGFGELRIRAVRMMNARRAIHRKV